MKYKYDLIVVGGGHAGCEAAISAAKRGAKTLMFIIKLETIGRMSCNPAIGGLAKGHLVREIDAMGGTIGKAIDKAGIHFRMLNKSKGPAVWAPRAQADRIKYQLVMRSYVEKQENLDIKEALIQHIIVKDGTIEGVKTQYGQEYFAPKIILAAGTFLKGKIHIGLNNYSSGRAGEFAAIKLSDSLQNHGLQLDRFKTGTPPRLDIRTLDMNKLNLQKPDEPPSKFSFYTDIVAKNYVNCYLTTTNPQTHKIIANNLKRSSLFSGNITGIGARYCPSIEDKIKKFPDKEGHQVFLEPEGRDTYEVYANGIPTSFPPEIQYKIVHSIQGLENAKFMRYGYAIEYDCIKTSEIKLSLETKKIKGLYLAGQINGTSGYEEAAAQGMVAAINAVNSLEGKDPIIFYRDNSYIGVLIDDIVTKGVDEPYRMFTARAEYRLYLRQDNADERLMPLGYALGMVSDKRFQKYEKAVNCKNNILQYLKQNKANTDSDKSYKLIDILRRPEIRFDDLKKFGYNYKQNIDDLIKNKIELQVKYEGYIKRQMKEIRKFKSLEHKNIPPGINFMELNNISYEAREKMSNISPLSVGQASRIPGVTYADISALLIKLKTLDE